MIKYTWPLNDTMNGNSLIRLNQLTIDLRNDCLNETSSSFQ